MTNASHIACGVCVAAMLMIAAAATPTPAPTPKPEAAPAAPTKAVVGLPAPGFTLVDTDGTSRALSDYSGRIVVLEWFNALCPFSGRQSPHAIHASGKAAELHRQLRAIDPTITFLLVDSSARRRTRDEVIEGDKAARATWNIAAPILIDYEGVVGRAYKAQTTPHMYVIDASGVLRYQGAFDDDQKNEHRETATNHVLEAVKRLKAGEQPSPSSTQAWGCGVKYKR